MGFILPLLTTSLPAASTGVIAGALFFAVVVTSLSFMIAYFFQSPRLTAMAHEELAALIFSAFIILFWIAGSGFLNGITTGVVGISGVSEYASSNDVGGLSISHIDLAIASNDIFLTKLKGLYINLYLYEVLIGFLSTISFPVLSWIAGPAMISFSLMPFISLGMLSGAHTSVVEAIGLLAAMLWAKEFILIFCRDVIPLILLPVGLVLRAFPLSRTTGSSIISVCFMGYFVFPMAVLFSYFVVFDLYEPSEPPPIPSAFSLFKTGDGEKFTQEDAEDLIEGPRSQSEHMHDDLFSAQHAAEEATSVGACEGFQFFCSISKLWQGAVSVVKGFVNTVKGIWLFMMGFMGDLTSFSDILFPSSVAAGLYDFIIREVTHVAQFIVIVVLTSIVEIIIAITMYRNISWIIGGEMELAGITKVM